MPSLQEITTLINKASPFMFISFLLFSNAFHYYVGTTDSEFILSQNLSVLVALAGVYIRDSFPGNAKLKLLSSVTTTVAFIFMPKPYLVLIPGFKEWWGTK
ncbi:hypothetical protein P170DRAFT_514074 [Aspergillus steynii IBT 23096]|uniref:Uncharacterized protein n=1 Tax=Aspergillus steynii IBT 23096 TaxID=1392250 RepID=A0A2I2FSX9_9EURO|nr:uncharacterized protein P170DRAFT_514074 [Aspergillus steynii IBT 23096]PLB43748.1 hypothetical protein P170DRAFT_514074 [Aspergillus steynii IBT 23096]